MGDFFFKGKQKVKRKMVGKKKYSFVTGQSSKSQCDETDWDLVIEKRLRKDIQTTMGTSDMLISAWT